MRCAVGANDSPINLECADVENYGTDIEVGGYLLNRDGALDYGEISGPAEIEAYEVSGKWNLIRNHQGKRNVLSGNFETKYTGPIRKWFRGMKSNFWKPIDRKQNSGGGRQARLSKVGCLILKGDCEQRILGRNQAWNKPACFERGDTDRFKSQCPIWLAETARWTNTHPAPKKKGGEQKGAKCRIWEKCKGKSVMFSFLWPNGDGLEIGEIPESKVNVATRQVNLSDIWGGSAGRNKEWPNEGAIIIDTGFNGGGLRMYAWFGEYLWYLGSFYSRAEISKTKGNFLRFSICGARRARFSNGRSNTCLGGRNVQTGACEVNSR